MKRNWKALTRILIVAFLAMVGIGAAGGILTGVPETQASPQDANFLSAADDSSKTETAITEVESEQETARSKPEAEPKKWVDPYEALPEYKDLCEKRPVVTYDDKGNEIKPKRRKLSYAQRKKQRRDIAIIAYAMGMKDPRPLWIPALRESSYRTWKRHKLNPDVEAAVGAWRNWTYSKGRERKLVGDQEDAEKAKSVAQSDMTRAKRKLAKTTEGTLAYNDAKAELDEAKKRFNKAWKTIAHSKAWLRRIRTYKDNPTWAAAGRWNTGYGLYGMQPVYFVARWDRNAPPEILCDSTISTVLQIWSARSSLSTCVSQGHPGTWEVSNRVMASGHCTPRPERVKFYRKRADGVGLDPQGKADFGTEWPRKVNDQQTDRSKVYEHMTSLIELADKKCLSLDDIQKWKGPTTAPDTCAEKEAKRKKEEERKARKAKKVAAKASTTASG